MRKAKVYVLQSASGVVVGGSDQFDNHMREEAERIGGTVLDGNGNIVFDATEGFQPLQPITERMPAERVASDAKAFEAERRAVQASAKVSAADRPVFLTTGW